jgi:hypothetical protein
MNISSISAGTMKIDLVSLVRTHFITMKILFAALCFPLLLILTFQSVHASEVVHPVTAKPSAMQPEVSIIPHPGDAMCVNPAQEETVELIGLTDGDFRWKDIAENNYDA